MPHDAAMLTGDPLFTGIIIVSAVVSIPLAVLGILAYNRRRSISYLFVASAFVAFLFKSIVGILTLLGVMNFGFHNLVEHGLDIIVGLLLLGAVFLARSSNRFDGAPFD